MPHRLKFVRTSRVRECTLRSLRHDSEETIANDYNLRSLVVLVLCQDGHDEEMIMSKGGEDKMNMNALHRFGTWRNDAPEGIAPASGVESGSYRV